MGEIEPLYLEAIVLLGGAVLAGPLFKRIGLGTVLGYLAAGIVIGPVTRFIRDADDILHFAELGVVMLLFIIGLELKPARLWNMRFDIFGLGFVQVMSCGIALTALAFPFVDNMQIALVAGFGLALSSTAFAMQYLEESGDISALHGRKAFAILLFQDLAIVPMLALIPLLSPRGDTGIEWSEFVTGIAAIVALVLAGRYLLNPLFRIIAKTGAREVMIAAALLLVFGAALLMQAAGMSMALGSFLAGVLLAESSYRHELEADIEPFRGLLLGLFFMAIGMSLELDVLAEYWMVILLCVPVALVTKAVLIYAASRLFSNGHSTSVRTAAVLTQHGEFAFVLFSAALSLGIIDRTFGSIMIAVVILSMALTPLCVRLGEFLVSREKKEMPDEDFDGAGSPVLMVGFSRLGQVASQALLASGIDVTIIDSDPEHIRNASKFGFKIYFGDGTRPEVLRMAGIGKSSLVAVCTAKPEITTRVVEMVQSEWPDKPLYVRTYDRGHTLDMMKREVDYQIRETFESALTFSKNMLTGLGRSDSEADEIVASVRKRDQERLMMQLSDGIQAGRHMLHTEPVRPEPLVEPKKSSEALDDRSREIMALEEEESLRLG